jgi:hypothetical protein
MCLPTAEQASHGRRSSSRYNRATIEGSSSMKPRPLEQMRLRVLIAHGGTNANFPGGVVR